MTTLTDNIVSYWKFDESSGNAADSAGSNTLTNNNVTYAPTKINNGAVFNGTTAYFQAGAFVIPKGAKSIAFWIKTPTVGSAYEVAFANGKAFNNGNGISMSIYGSGDASAGKILIIVRQDSGYVTYALSSIRIDDDTLRHIVFTWDGTTATDATKLYINGVLDSSTTAIGTEPNDPAFNLRIGRNVEGSEFFSGSFDEFGVWSRAITSSEVMEVFNFGNGKQYAFPNTNSFFM